MWNRTMFVKRRFQISHNIIYGWVPTSLGGTYMVGPSAFYMYCNVQ